MNQKTNKLEQVLTFVREELRDFGVDDFWLADQVEDCISDYPGTNANLYRMAREIAHDLLLKLKPTTFIETVNDFVVLESSV